MPALRSNHFDGGLGARAEAGLFGGLLLALVLGLVHPALASAPESSETSETQAVPAGDEVDSQARAETLTQALDADSGVAIQTVCTNCNNADLSLGGLGNEHVAVVCDGLPVPAGLGQIYLLSVMPSTMIDKVAVRKGPGEVNLAGGSVGGGIEIERREPRPGLQLNASADGGSFGWGGSKVDVSGRSGRFGGSFIGSVAKSDSVDASDDGNPELGSFDRYTLEGKGEIEITQHQNLRLGAAKYDESQENGPSAYNFLLSGFSTSPGETVYDRENVDLDREQYDAAYDISSENGTQLTAGVSWSQRTQDVWEGPPGTEPTPTYDIEDRNRFLGVSFLRPLGSDSTLRGGVTGSRQEYEVVDVRYRPDEVLTDDITETGVWIEGESGFSGKLTVTAGLRYVDFTYEDNENRAQWLVYDLPEGDRILPRAAVTWKPDDALQLRFSGGAGFRQPSAPYEKVCCGHRYRRNHGIEMERSQAFGVEAVYQPGPRWKVSGTGFWTDFRDMVRKLAVRSSVFQPTYQNVNVPEARQLALGLEGRVDVTTWLAAKGSVSWIDAENRTPGDAIPVVIENDAEQPVARSFQSSEIPYLAERRGALSLELGPWQRFSAGISAQYTGPMLIQQFYEDNFDIGDPGDFSDDLLTGVHFTEDSFVSTESYWTVGVNLSRSFKAGLSLYGGVDNLGDYVQPDLGNPEFDYKWGPLRGRYYFLGMRYEFER